MKVHLFLRTDLFQNSHRSLFQNQMPPLKKKMEESKVVNTPEQSTPVGFCHHLLQGSPANRGVRANTAARQTSRYP